MALTYKPIIRRSRGPYSGAAMVGTYSTVIGWNFDDAVLRQGLLGFAIKRTETDKLTNDIIELSWLGGFKRFASVDTGAFGDISSREAPFQRFRWNDYTLRPTRNYKYEVFPVRGQPGNLTMDEDPLVFSFTPSEEDDGNLGVYVNRGVSAAKAYFQRFGDTRPEDVSPPTAAFSWLSRGLRESLFALFDSAQPGDALHLAVYEFFDLEIANRLKQLADNNVEIRIVHDAKSGKKSTGESRHIVHLSGLDQVANAVSERTTVNISHNKLVIHLRNDVPIQAWTGTANLSENGFNYQTNCALLVRDATLLQNYETYFQNLWNNPTKAASKDFNIPLMQAANTTPGNLASKIFFSPIRKQEIIETAVDLIQNAQSMVLISAPFGIHKDMKAALRPQQSGLIEYGLVNATAQSKVADLRNNSTRFFPPKKLKTFQNERWDAKHFGAHKIHTKSIIVDPYSDNPKVFIGSANFSKASCVDNDENAILVEGDKRLAAIMTTEYMRMYDHYKSRFYIERSGGHIPNFHLKEDEDWSRTAFDPNSNSHKFADRLAFSGRK